MDQDPDPAGDTPALCIDLARLDANLRRMQARADALGVALRPHVKTHKCLPVAERQRALGAPGITVSTLKEAEYFHARGFDDILYAVAVAPNKLPRAMALCRAGCRLTLLVDGAAGAAAVARFGAAHGHRFDVMLEVDTDGHRAGLAPEGPALLAAAAALAPQARLAGVMTHAGGSYALHDPEALRAAAEQERAGCVHAAERLRAAGFACPAVSVGSTPTALSAASLQGVTELRAGVYAFFDLVMLGTGVCTREELALCVRTSVIGHQTDRQRVLIDAGWMAMSRDRGTQSQACDWGYGALRDPATGRWLPELGFVSANQEHGVLAAAADVDIERRFPIGSVLEILPNHACATAAQFGAYELLRGGVPTGERWERLNGW
jgi:D-serine deaminase-like pyridoxal phosphate-dependent protein